MNVIELSPPEFAVPRLRRESRFLGKNVDSFDPPLIQTLRGVGYSLRLGSAATPEGT
jgi:DNA-binding response OmpR family regulator